MAEGGEEETSWEEIRAGEPQDERMVAVYRRMMELEQRMYQLMEKHGREDRDEEAFIKQQEVGPWVAELGEKVASLGGHLELAAVFPDESVQLLREPSP